MDEWKNMKIYRYKLQCLGYIIMLEFEEEEIYCAEISHDRNYYVK